MFVFSAKVLKFAFDSSEYQKLEEEINRLYRSNAFNITERKLHLESQYRMYPQLKDPQTKESSDELGKRLM